MARRRISFAICYIAFKTRFNFKKHMKRVHPFNVCEKAFKSLQTPNQNIIWQHSSYVFVCRGCCKKFKTNNSINTPRKLIHFKPHYRKSFCNFSMWGKGGGRRGKGRVCLAPGRGQTSSTILVGNIYFFFIHKIVKC